LARATCRASALSWIDPPMLARIDPPSVGGGAALLRSSPQPYRRFCHGQKTSRDNARGQRGPWERLARLRKEKTITRVELGEKLQTSQSIVSKYEKGDLLLHGKLIARLTEILGVSADELLGTAQQSRRSGPRLSSRADVSVHPAPSVRSEIAALFRSEWYESHGTSGRSGSSGGRTAN
jgi:transcriptional regulator with XRE-family HTH domain